jgi:transcriptional regulator with XRE-family HTH domain
VPRRTPGLRRREVAELAGLSVGYYTRLEQGHAAHPSASVLSALARTFHLSDNEERHLRALADDNHHPAAAGPERPSPSGLRLINLLVPGTAAVILGRTGDVLAWNATATLLFPGRLPAPGTPAASISNNVRYVFQSPEARSLFIDWPAVADDTVAHLRSATGHLTNDPAVRALLEDLSTTPEFTTRWTRRDVQERVSGEKHLNHPTLGRITVTYDVTTLLDTQSQWLVVYSHGPSHSPSIDRCPGCGSRLRSNHGLRNS